MKITNNLGMLLLAIYLIATGLFSLTSLSFPGAPQILALLALAAGILILLKR